MRKTLSFITLILFYLIFVAACMEGGVRLLRSAPPPEAPGFFWETNNPLTGWRLIPNAEGRWFNPMFEYDTHVKVNARALRTPETIDYEKPPGVYRVLVLGDSFVEAAQVDLEESFPQQLARLLQEHGLQAEVINAGVGGWGNDQELIWLREEGSKYKPDLVLLTVFPRNDFMNNYQPLESANMGANLKPYFRLENGKLVAELFPFDPAQAPPVEHKRKVVQVEPLPLGPLTAVGEWLQQHSAFYRYFDPRIRLAAPRFAALLSHSGLIKPGGELKRSAQGEDYYPIAYDVYNPQPTEEWRQAFTLSEVIYAEIKRTANDMGAATAAVLIAAPEQVITQNWQKIVQENPPMQGRSWSLGFPTQKAAELLKAAGIPTLDTLALFRQRQAAGDKLHFADDGHWTRLGHALAARAIFNFVSSSALIAQLQGASVPIAQCSWGHLAWDGFVWLIVLALAGSLLWSIYKNGLRHWLRNLAVSLTTVGELLLYTIQRRRFALLPVLILLLLFGGLLVVAQASALGPFIYTLF